jgi:hypothetical protein
MQSQTCDKRWRAGNEKIVNRNRPPMPMPAPGFQSPPFGAPSMPMAPQSQGYGLQSQGYGSQSQAVFAPDILDALIRQSESNYMIARERTMKFDEASGALEMEAQNMSIELANRGMGHALDPVSRASETMRQEMQAHRALLDAVLQSELSLQGNFKRWASGQMPQQRYGTQWPLPPSPPLASPSPAQSPFAPQQGFAPAPGAAQQSQQQPQQSPLPPPPIGPGGFIDYSDPRQAAEALKRAIPMPMGPQQQAQMPMPMPQPMQQQSVSSGSGPYPYPYGGPGPYPYPHAQPPMPPQPPQQMAPQQMAPQQIAPMPMPMSTPLEPTSLQYQQIPMPAQPSTSSATNGAAKTS